MLGKKWDVNLWSLEKADELGKLAVLHSSADESAKHVRGLYITFILFAFYVSVIVFSTNDEQLLKETGALLPLLNIELPLRGFYFFIPWLVILSHLHLIIQFYLLSRKLHNLNRAIAGLPKDAQVIHRELPFPLIFSYMVLGLHHPRLMRFAFNATVVVPVIIVPVILLIAIQWKFLPYHSSGITWNHRIVVLLDLLILWMFLPRIAARSGRWRVWWPKRISPYKRYIKWPRTKRHLRQILRVSTAVLFTLLLWLIDWFLLVPPQDGIEFFLDNQPWLDKIHRNLVLSEKTLMKEEPSPELIAAYKETNESQEMVWLDHGIPLDLRMRDLRAADFSKSILWDVDLRGAQLQRANLMGTKLQRANLTGAKLQGANLSNAQLQGANLHNAELQGANLMEAQLQGANLNSAQLQGVDAFSTNFQGANLSYAQCQGAYFQEAQFQGAELFRGQLQGADFYTSQLEGADLRNAQLQGAGFIGSRLKGANLQEAKVYATDFNDSDLTLANLRGLVSEPVGWENIPINLSVVRSIEELESQLTNKPENWSEVNVYRKRIQKAISSYWDVTFDLPHKVTQLLQSQAPGALYDQCGLFTLWPSPPEDKSYDKKQAEYLAKLACNNKFVAQALVTRATSYDLSLYWPNLAQALIDQADSAQCQILIMLIEKYRKKLEDIISLEAEAATGIVSPFPPDM